MQSGGENRIYKHKCFLHKPSSLNQINRAHGICIDILQFISLIKINGMKFPFNCFIYMLVRKCSLMHIALVTGCLFQPIGCLKCVRVCVWQRIMKRIDVSLHSCGTTRIVALSRQHIFIDARARAISKKG